ncbi:hypothetical protein Cyagr_1914 [Cyanobium gracile PCC 6307]|uniref:Uncharacterized protein n=1 Tax=Cyanobium gracile (strain ATCC 27147 / PCC 6307) TaxID=292564 RepID=K9P8K0_CYAGP|nr:hypothetical protein Cyagr_1914 [Cyanobium gracile PCC 6307]
MPDEVVGIEASKPADQQVVVQLFHHHPLRADAIDRLQQQGQQQLLRRDRGPAALGVEPAEGGLEPIQGLIRQPPGLAQGWPDGIRSSVEMYENRGLVHSCCPRIRSVPLGHSPATGQVFQQTPRGAALAHRGR